MKIISKTILFGVLTVIFTVLLGWFQQGSDMIPTWAILPQLAPGLAAWLMLGVFRDQKTILKAPISRIKMWKFVIAIGLPILLTVAQLLLYQLIYQSLQIPPFQGTRFSIMLSWMFVGAFAEELGWRGYLQPLLSGKINGVFTSLVVGIAWGGWHIGNYQHGFLYMLFFVLSTLSYSLIITWLIRDAGWNVILPLMFHLTVNLGYYVFSSVLTEPRFMVLNGFVWMAAAAMILALNWKFFIRPPAQ